MVTAENVEAKTKLSFAKAKKDITDIKEVLLSLAKRVEALEKAR